MKINYAELSIIFVQMVNSIVYPNYFSSAYFAYTLLMTLFAMSQDKTVNQFKFFLAIAMIVACFIIGVGKYR